MLTVVHRDRFCTTVSNHPSLSHLQIFATHELSKVFHLTFRGGKIRQGFDTICAGAVQAQTNCTGGRPQSRYFLKSSG